MVGIRNIKMAVFTPLPVTIPFVGGTGAETGIKKYSPSSFGRGRILRLQYKPARSVIQLSTWLPHKMADRNDTV